MTITYEYGNISYNTEDEAHSAALVMKSRLENNPTDWCIVKEILPTEDGAWLIRPDNLSNADIMNPSEEKRYSIYSRYTGENIMPLTSSELSAKVTEFRKAFVNHYDLLNITKVDTEGGSSEEGYTASFTTITPNVDMSGYV